MKYTQANIASVLCILSLITVFLSASLISLDSEALFSEWKGWKDQYSKTYKSEAEETRRFLIWRKNRDRINEHNSKDVGYTLGLNHFADLTDEEFKKLYAPKRKPILGNENGVRNTAKFEEIRTKLGKRDLPDEVDWRKKDVLNPPKDQGGCGSCYAFSTIGSIESHWAIKTGQKVNLSEQQIVDCAVNEGDDACDGGLVDFSFNYAIMRGITTEKKYPYVGKTEQCRFIRDMSDSVWVHNYVDLPSNDEFAMKMTLALIGPVSIAIDASADFRFYTGGVFNSTLCQDDAMFLDHAVMAVGYGTDKDSGQDFWIVRNSWSPGWGENGYIRMARTKPHNLCGVVDMPSFPLL